MNELVESDDEINAADTEMGRIKSALDSEGEEGEKDDEDDYDTDERSLMDSDDERLVMRKAKGKNAKINNSFTGPYPLDPTDFNHTDKGPNQQFEHLLLRSQL